MKTEPHSHLRFPAALGLGAGGMTAAFLLSQGIARVVERIPEIDVPLEFGLLLATVPFGGVHGSTPPQWVTVGSASLVNGAIWFGIGRMLYSLSRRLRSAPPSGGAA